MKQKLLIGVIGVAIIGVIANALFFNSSKTGVTDDGTGLTKGSTPPQFTLENLQNESISLQDVKGTNVILNF
ncbi:MAG: hypothetical protein ABS882_05255, partial [Lysinibacillus sp.]